MTVDGTIKAFMKIWNGPHYCLHVYCAHGDDELLPLHWMRAEMLKRAREYEHAPIYLPKNHQYLLRPISSLCACVCVCFLQRHLPISFRCNINKITNVYSNFILFVCSSVYLFVYYLVIILTSIIVRYICKVWALQCTIHNSLSNVLSIFRCRACALNDVHVWTVMVDWVTSCLTPANQS